MLHRLYLRWAIWHNQRYITELERNGHSAEDTALIRKQTGAMRVQLALAPLFHWVDGVALVLLLATLARGVIAWL